MAAEVDAHVESWRTGGTRLYGMVEGHTIEMVTPFYGLLTTGQMCHAADLGLEVTSSRGGGGIETGNKDFDAMFRLRADEPDLARRVFSADFAATLMQHGLARPSLRINDWGAQVTRTDFTGKPIRNYPSMHPRDAIEDYRMMAWLLRALTARLQQNPGPTPLTAHVEAWRSFAEAHRMGFSPSPLAMWGEVHNMRISAQPIRTGVAQYELAARLQHAAPLGLGLQLQRGKRSLLGSLFGSAVQTQDEQFDALYEAKADDTEQAAKLLDTPTRRLLIELAEAYPRVTVTDVFMVVDCGPLDDPDVSLRAIKAMQQVSSALTARAAPIASPYR